MFGYDFRLNLETPEYSNLKLCICARLTICDMVFLAILIAVLLQLQLHVFIDALILTFVIKT